MDAGLLEGVISKNRPFRIETASGRVFDVPHGEEHFAIVPLLTVTAAMIKA
jgi:hypothetical protein